MEATTVRGRKFSYSHTIGNLTIFRYPVDVGLDADNNVYVVNRGHDGDWVFGVNKMTLDEDEIGRFGGEGSTDGRFVWPHRHCHRQPETGLRGRRMAQPHFHLRHNR